LRRTKREREKTEEQMVLLVEQVIEKLKREMIEMNI
jgi:NMD protein affecting ribosome stability and mRNA decay